jgi:hypothetical protein
LDHKLFRERKILIKYLIAQAPQLLLETDAAGNTPLSLACKTVCHHRLISLLVQSNPQALKIGDFEQETPLHHGEL